jgi:hypothetical protein
VLPWTTPWAAQAVTFRWPPVVLPPAHLAVPAVPTSHTSPGPLPALATAKTSTPPGLGTGTVFYPQPGPLPRAVALFTIRAPAMPVQAAGPVRPLTSSGGAVASGKRIQT